MLSRRLVPISIIILCGTCAALHAAVGAFSGQSVVRVDVKTAAQLKELYSISDALWSCTSGVGQIDVQVTPKQLAALQESGLSFKVWIEDVQPLIDAQFPVTAGGTYHGTYHTLAEINARIQQYVTDHPGIASMVNFGTSLEGRSLLGLRITGPGSAAGRPGFFIHGGQHAREWVSPATMVYIAEWLVTNYGSDPVATRLIDNVEWFILPVLNPDGYEFTWLDLPNNRMWRKNRRDNGDGTFGVDLNRNWGWQWGGAGSSGNTASETYRGPSAFSEPETQAMRDFILAHPNITAYIDFHSYSELILWPWGYTPALSPDNDEFAYAGTQMADRLAAEHNHIYTAGPVYTTIYQTSGGSGDWVYGANAAGRLILAMAVELRDKGETGFLLPPEQIVPTAEENLAAVLILANVIAEPLRVELLSAVPPTLGAGETLTVAVKVTERRETFASNDVSLFYRLSGGALTEASMSGVGGGEFEAVIPPSACGPDLEFYVTAIGDGGGTAGYPAYSPVESVSIDVGREVVEMADDLEAATAWTVGAAGDNATFGVWTRVDPVGTPAQPEDDHTQGAGSMCFVTGQGQPGGGIGVNDVDGGKTTLLSPIFSVLGADSQISYARWYSNDQGPAPNSDQMTVDISNNGGQSWTPVEIVTENAGVWVVHAFTPGELGLAATSQMQLRFVASDYGQGSIVEAGIDDLLVSGVLCQPPNGDANGDGVVDTSDHAAFAACMNGPTGETVPPGCGAFNFDNDANVDMDDFLLFTSMFGQP